MKKETRVVNQSIAVGQLTIDCSYSCMHAGALNQLPGSNQPPDATVSCLWHELSGLLPTANQK